MPLTPKPARTTPHCKIKRVNPAFRSVSTPRSTKDLPVVGPVNPTSTSGSPSEPRSVNGTTLEASAESLCEVLQIGLAPAPSTRLVQVPERRGATLERLFDSTPSEAA